MAQIELKFQIQFMSDWHIGAGYGASSDVSAVLERDAQDSLVINGTTLKGVFRDALYDLALNLGLTPEVIQSVLGAPGIDSRWQFSVAQTDVVTNDSALVSGVRVDPRFRRAEDKKFFNREIGTSQPIYKFTVSGNIPDEGVIEEVEWLVAAASYIERLGGQRRRGRGRCTISLGDTELHHAFLDSFGMRHCDEIGEINHSAMVNAIIVQHESKSISDSTHEAGRYRIVLYTERPLVISQKPESGNVYQGRSIIPGQTLRGALAGLADPNQMNSDQYEIFKQLFLLGGLRLSNLTPLRVKETNAVPLAQLPIGLQRIKEKDDEFTSVFNQLAETKSYSGWVILESGMPKAKNDMPNIEAHPHIAINPDLKRASDGALFTYEAIPAGNYYIGELKLSDKNWKPFGDLIKVNPDEAFEIRIGKGRNRSYGLCRVIIMPIKDDIPVPWIHSLLKSRLGTQSNDTLLMTLASDAIVQDKWGRFYGRFDKEWLAKELKCSKDDFDIVPPSSEQDLPEQVVRTTLVQSFDARSGVPRWRDQALVEGSTVHLRFKSGKRPSEADLHKIEVDGVGLRRNEGYGRVVFNHPAHIKKTDIFETSFSLSNSILPMSKRKPSNAKFSHWLRSILDKEESLKKLDDIALLGMARQLQHVLNCEPEAALAEVKSYKIDAEVNKSSVKSFQKLRAFIEEILVYIYDERRRYWRVTLVLLIERLLKDGGNQHAT